MGKYIPGQPTIVVENMPGAGSMISANHIGKAAKPDGSAAVTPSLFRMSRAASCS
jgi:hypothetical protein